MSIAVLVTLGLDLLMCAAMYLYMQRVGKVSICRRKMINMVFKHYDYEWRVAVMESVSFGRMVFTFWKPATPRAFYTDLSFLHSKEVTGAVLSPFQIKRV